MALVSGVALPLVVLAVFVTGQLWQQQRQGYQQQFLERANAVRLALDTQFESTLRTLRAAGDAAEVSAPDVQVVLLRRFRRLLDNYPAWDAVALTDAQGRVIMAAARPGTAELQGLAVGDVRRAMSSGTGFVSNVALTHDGRHIVFAATAIVHDGATQGVIYAAIRHTYWLDLLRTHPVSQRGTLTLIDRDATVITRTLDDARWAGQKAPADFWARTRDKASGAFETNALDGTPFYAAFSRSSASGWLLTTGVPQAEVDEALYRQTWAVLLLAAIAISGALVAAIRLGSDVNASLLGLLGSTQALTDRTPLPSVVLPIREARVVRDALVRTHEQLLVREASLHAALAREGAAREQAESGSRAKDQFLAMMGHELRNPLSAITASVDLLGAAALPEATLRRTRDIIKRQAGHLASMIDDLMDVAQLGSGDIVLRKTRVDLAQVAARVLARFDETGRSTHLQMRTGCVPAWVDADEARVELLMTCLLDNACRYTPGGGTVTLEVTGTAGSSILLIRDTGAGFAPDVAARMFDAFAQGARNIERSEGGLGLGLAVARKLVDLHGGAIEAASAGPGMGATFTVTFPKAEAPPAIAPTAAPAPGLPRDLQFTIVEDLAETRELMVMLLEAQGRRINAAADGPSGVKTILDGPSDVAVVDIGLPGFDGLEVARRVRESPDGDQVLLIALTGYGTEADRARAFAAGFDAFLVKPFDADELDRAITDGLASKDSSRAAHGTP